MPKARDLREEFNEDRSYKETWLEDAEEVSYLTLPRIRVKDYLNNAGKATTQFGRTQSNRNGQRKPITSVGRDGVNNLANTLLSLLFPISVNWFRLKLDADQVAELVEAGEFESEEEIESTLREIEDKMLSTMDSHLLRSELHESFIRNIIEGNNVLHVYRRPGGETDIRLIPMRDISVRRFNGRVVKLYIRDHVPGKDGTPVEQITCVDYETDEVLRYNDDGSRKTPQKVKGDRASYYIPFTSTRPTVEDYAESYAHELIGDLNFCDMLSRNINSAHAIYSKVILVNNEDVSGVSIYDLADLEPGEAIDGNVSADGRAEGIGFVSASLKPNETNVAEQRLQRVEDRVSRQFGGGIGNIYDNLAQPRTATEIAQVASELDKFVAGLGQHYQAELLMPLAQAYLDLVMSESGNDPRQTAIKPKIIAGTTQLSRLQELSRFMQLLSTQLSLNPQFAQEIKWREVWRRMTNALGLDTDDLLKTDEELQSEQAAIAQAQQQELIDAQQLQALRQQRIRENNQEQGGL